MSSKQAPKQQQGKGKQPQPQQGKKKQEDDEGIGAGEQQQQQQQQDQLKAKEKVQAILIADTFDNNRFATVGIPSVLMPVAGSPLKLLDYTLEMLYSNGVQEVFIACGNANNCSLISKHVHSTPRWNSSTSHFKAVIVESPDSFSVGDLLRDVFGRQLIQSSEFVLVFGDVVSNMDLNSAIKMHKQRREKDKASILTLVLSNTGPRHPSRSLEDETLLAIDTTTNQILSYDCSTSTHSVKLSPELFAKHKSVDIRLDLLDPGIAICSPEVLQQLQDNFDFRSLTPDLIKGLLDHVDILGYHAYVHLLSQDKEFAVCSRDLRTYMSVCRDVIKRWAFPLVPESNFMLNTSFVSSRNSVYREASSKCCRGAVLEREVCIGEGTTIGENALVSRTTILRSCKIGSNSIIRGSILWDSVSIGQRTTINDSLICKGVTIFDDVFIHRGCVIGPNVIIGKGKTIPPFTKLVATNQQLPADQNGHIEQNDLGEDGVGFVWKDSNEVPETNTLVPHDEREINANWGGFGKQNEESGGDNSSEESDEGVEESAPLTSDERLEIEIADLVDTALQGMCPIDEFNLQVRGLRMSYNSTWVMCGCLILKKLLESSYQQSPSNQNEFVKNIRKVVSSRVQMLTPYIQSDAESDQVELISYIQDLCRDEETAFLKDVFEYIIHALYNSDIITEDAIWNWVEKQNQPDALNDSQSFLKLCEKFLTWLKTADEEDD